jgi:diadenosine tetraphosphate (Ap4A) HIT family hydrolase
MTTVIHRNVDAARAGTNEKVIARMRSGWAVMGDTQFLPGYSLLLPDPVVPSPNDMAEEARAQFFRDMVLLGDAVLRVTGADRINYEILGNLEPALHAHVFPRHGREPAAMRVRPVWFYGDERDKTPFDLTRDRPLMDKIAAALKDLGGIA